MSFGLVAVLIVVVLVSLGPASTTLSRVLHSPQKAHRAAAVHTGAQSASKNVHVTGRKHRALQRPLTAQSTVLAYPPPPLQAHAAFLMDVDTGRILYAKNPDLRLPMASTTKITTAVVTLQHARLNEMVRVSKKAATIGESTMVLKRGERLTVKQLLYGLLLNSANDAAIALAEHVAGSEKRFVGMMNLLARTLGMRNTHYATSHGLDAPNHYSSARDLSIIASYAMRYPLFRQIVATEGYHIPPTRHNKDHWLANINRVMYWYPGVDGVKPGMTDDAGFCQVVSVRRDGRHLLAVLLNTQTLVYDIRNLLDFGLRDFRWVQAPAYWDVPANSLSGGSGKHKWIYYFGAGHYIRGLFLHYFRTHGGLQTLGYPRTEVIRSHGSWVQYFQGAELIYDSHHRSVHPADLGSRVAHHLLSLSRLTPPPPPVATQAGPVFRHLGGKGVFGKQITAPLKLGSYLIRYYQFGALADVNGGTYVVPLGDAILQARGWLSGPGTADAYPPTMSRYVLARLASLHVPGEM